MLPSPHPLTFDAPLWISLPIQLFEFNNLATPNKIKRIFAPEISSLAREELVECNAVLSAYWYVF